MSGIREMNAPVGWQLLADSGGSVFPDIGCSPNAAVSQFKFRTGR